MMVTFNVLPLVLLTLYPFRKFQTFLNYCCPSLKCKVALHMFMDAIQGCYKDTPHDYRHFASLYLALRFFNLLLYSIFNYSSLSHQAASLVLVVTLALVAKFQPYKCRRSNTTDMVMLFAMIAGYTSMTMHRTTPMFPRWPRNVVVAIMAMIPQCYIVFLILNKILPKEVYVYCLSLIHI